MGVDTLGHLLALHVTPANEQDRAQVAQLAEQEQDVTDASAEGASVDQGDTGGRAKQDAVDHGMQLKVVKRPQAQKGFVRLPRRWVVERSFGSSHKVMNDCRERWLGGMFSPLLS